MVAGALIARSDQAPRRSAMKRALLVILALAGIAGLIGLGIWQLERRIWKLDLIAQVDGRVHAATVPAPGPSAWPYLSAANDAYRRVRITGHFLDGHATLVKAVTEYGGGYWVLAPFRTADGFTVLVNRGFIPEENAKSFPNPEMADASLTGLLRMTEPGGAFLRHNDPAAGRWYSRDVDAISAALGIHAAPYFIDADASANREGAPIGGLTVIAFHNNHLVYALTWFGLAAMLAAWLVHLLRLERRAGSHRDS